MKALQFNVSAPRWLMAKLLGALLGRWVYYSSPLATIKYVDIPEPILPSEKWVKVKTIYCGFCGSDLNLVFLHDSPTASPFTSFPCIIGHEFIGEIVAVGKEVRGVKKGDIVAVNPALGCAARNISPRCPSCSIGIPGNCENFAEGDLPPGMFIGICSGVNGGFAPYVVAPGDQVFKVPQDVSNEWSVMTEPLSVGVQAVLNNRPEKSDKVLVVGGGVIGNMIVQAIRALDIRCSITVIEPSPFHAELTGQVGADNLIVNENVFERTSEITGAKIYKPMIGTEILMGGFNRIFDTVGNSSTLNMSMKILAAHGTLSVVGISGDVKLDVTPLWLKLQKVQGVYAYGLSSFKGKKREIFDISLELMKKKKVKLDNLVTHTFRIEDYKEMINVNMNKGKHKAVKTVVSFI